MYVVGRIGHNSRIRIAAVGLRAVWCGSKLADGVGRVRWREISRDHVERVVLGLLNGGKSCWNKRRRSDWPALLYKQHSARGTPESYPRAIISSGEETIASKVGYETAIIASADGSEAEERMHVLDLRRLLLTCQTNVICEHAFKIASPQEDSLGLSQLQGFQQHNE
jgi:hypothetical protein